MQNEITKFPKVSNLGLFDLGLIHGNNYTSKERIADSFEIELPVNDGGLSYIDNNVYPVQKDRLICVKPGQRRKSKAPFTCQYIHISPDDSEICRLLTKLPDTIELKDEYRIPSLFDEILIEYARKSNSFSLLFYAKLFTLFDELQSKIETMSSRTVKGNLINIKAVEIAVNYIDDNYMRNISLGEIANFAHLSSSYLHKVFKNVIGITPFEYMMDKRIKKSKQLLTITNIPISDIAISCGFTDQSYFGKVFREKTGYTPLNYRNKSNEMYP